MSVGANRFARLLLGVDRLARLEYGGDFASRRARVSGLLASWSR